MNSRARTAITVLGIIGLALLLRLHYVNSAIVDQPIRGDATQYVQYALNVTNHRVFGMGTDVPPVPDSYRSPGYPIALAAIMKLTDDFQEWYRTTLLIQAFFGATSAALAYTSARLLGLKWAWALAAGLLTAIWPHHVTATGYLLTESLFGVLLLLTVMLVLWTLRNPQALTAAGAGAMLGLAAMVNLTAAPLAIIAAICVWRRSAFAKGAILLGAAVVLPLAWEVRNAVSVDSSETSATRVSQNFVQGSWPTYHRAYRAAVNGDPVGKEILAAISEEEDLLASDRRAGFAIIWQRIAEDPLYYLQWYALEKPGLLWGWGIRMGQGDIYTYPTRNSPYERGLLWPAMAALCVGLNAPLGIAMLLYGIVIGLALARWQWAPNLAGSRTANLWVAGTLIYFTLMHMALQAEPRFSIPLRPLQFIAAAAFTAWAVQMVRKAKSSRQDA